MNGRDDQHLLSGAYALGALDEVERQEFETALNGSEELRTEVAEMTETAVMLGLASRPVDPPPALKANLMALIASTPQLGAIDGASAPAVLRRVPADASAPAPVGPVPPLPLDAPAEPDSVETSTAGASTVAASGMAVGASDTPVGRAEATARARWFQGPARAILSAAAAIALLAGGIAIGTGFSGRDGLEEAQSQALVELTAADDLQQSISTVAGGGEAKLLWSNDLQRSALVFDDLPQLASDRTYELWYIDESGATPAGLLDAAADGTSWRVLEGDLPEGASVGVTVEPEGGSDAPTTEPIVVIQA